MIKKIILSLVFGILGTVFALQYDEQVKTAICKGFAHMFQDTFGCTFIGTVASVNFFWPRVTFINVHVTPLVDHEWHWTADEYTSCFSWWHLLIKGALDLRVYMKKVYAYSTVARTSVAIGPHLQKMFAGPQGMPIILKVVDLNHATFELYDPEHDAGASCSWHSLLQKLDGALISSFTIIDGACTYKGIEVLKKVAGPVRLEIATPPGKEMHLNVIGRMGCMAYNGMHTTDELVCTGTWNGNQGECTLNVADTLSMTLNANTTTQPCLSFHAAAPLPFVVDILFPVAHGLSGDLLIDGSLSLDESLSAHVTGVVTNVMYKKSELIGKAECAFMYHNKQISGTLALAKDDLKFDGALQWNLDAMQGVLSCANTRSLSYPGISYSIDPHGLQAAAQFTLSTFKGEVTAAFEGPEKFSLKAIIAGDSSLPTIHATISQADHQCATATFEGVNQAHAQVDASWAAAFAKKYTGFDICAQGKIALDAVRHGALITGSFDFGCGAIRVAPLYNCIEKVYGSFTLDTALPALSFDNVRIGLNRGNIELAHGIVKKIGKTFFAQFPFILDRCVIPLGKDTAGGISGNLRLELQPDSLPSLSGALIIERSKIKGNIFSPSLFKRLISPATSCSMGLPEIALDLELTTKDSVRIDTAFIEAQAALSGIITGTLQDPQISARAQLAGGVLHFPYKPLYIVHSSLEFIPNGLTDPLIELVAKNTINKHQITLTLSGTAHNHHLSLESSPPLTHDQIIALLLMGADQESLPAAIPAALIDTLKHLFFDQEQTGSAQGYFRRMAEIFAQVRFVPSFINQTARGGLRGSLEIDIGEQWRALIEKNFTLTEDTRLELDYFLCDEITLRGVRDERRNVSGQVEMRVKF